MDEERHRQWLEEMVRRASEAAEAAGDSLRRIEHYLTEILQTEYAAAGEPLGPGVHALDMWVEYGTRTTVN